MEAHYNAQDEVLEVSLHVFIDDFELALNRLSEEALYLGTKKENPDADGRIQQYLKQRLIFTSDEAVLPISYLGKEVSDDYMAFYLYFTVPWSGSSLTCTNEILTEVYDDQQNMLSIEKMGKTVYQLFNVEKVKMNFF